MELLSVGKTLHPSVMRQDQLTGSKSSMIGKFGEFDDKITLSKDKIP